MAKSVKERVRAFRERLKRNPNKQEQYKNKDKCYQKLKRLSAAYDKTKVREKCRERVLLYRQRKKIKAQQNVIGEDGYSAYRTPQTLGKAVKRVLLALPVSPRKRKVVVTKIADQHGVKKCCLGHQGSNRNISSATKACVENFYKLDSISRQAPGIRDYVVIRIDGNKKKLQKRHLLCSLKETYSIFQESHPNIKISLSKFCSLRPPNVLLSSKMPRNVCLCEKHDNMRLLCEAIHNVVPEVPLYSSDILHTIVCNSDDEKCMTGKCKNCPKWIDAAMDSAPLDEEMSWYQWERVPVKLPQKKGKSPKTKKMIRKVLKEGTVEEAIETLEEKMPAFLDHIFVKRRQSHFFEEKISNLQPDEAAIQIDFSENYTCGHQDEIQAAHWDKSQVTIFPVVVWTKDGSESCTFVSDERSHDKKSVSVFLDKVLSRVAKEHPSVKLIHIFSDGPSSQFKNKYMVYLIHKLQVLSGLQLRWHYFASSHGKGAVDGVGGTVKRSVWSAVVTRKVAMVNDAKSFTSTANDVCNLSTDVALVTKKEILKKYPVYGLNKAKSIPGISKVHCIEPCENGTIILKKYSSQHNKMSIGEICYSDEESSTVEGFESEVYSVDSVEGFESEVYSVDSVEGFDSEDEASLERTTTGDSGAAISDDECDQSMAESVNEDECHKGEVDEVPDKQNKPNGAHDVKFYLPNEILENLSRTIKYSLPQSKKPIVEAILLNDYPFEGGNLIDLSDLKELSGRSTKDRDKWLSNFIIDAYLDIVSKHSSLSVMSVSWERFERCSVEDLAKELADFANYDLVLVPCNEASTEHWFLVALLPKKKYVAVFDSLAMSGKLKPKVKRSLNKCADLVHVLEPTVKWDFFCGQEPQVLQQGNGFDCGVFVCMYSRALALGDPLIDPLSVPEFRLGMIVELHEEMLSQLSDSQPQIEAYYAIDYGKKYFIGRLLSIESGLLKFKFLHSFQYKGCTSYRWPNRADSDKVHPSRLVYGPLQMHLDERHSFTIKNINLNKLFHSYIKQKSC